MSAATATRRKLVLAKLEVVCDKIARILAKGDVELGDIVMPHEREPGLTKLERLQLFKKLLNDTLAELHRGEARACRVCQQPLGDSVLDDMPWATACRGCAAHE